MHASRLICRWLLLCSILTLAATCPAEGQSNQQPTISITDQPADTEPSEREPASIQIPSSTNLPAQPAIAQTPTVIPAAPTVIADADWPQVARDPQRTNASPQSVKEPYRFYWRWMGVPIASRIQPVVADGYLFIGSLTGVMYALDAAYDAHGGSPHIIWQRDLGSPIRAAAGVAGNIVVVGTQHGAIYGLDAGTGVPRWSIATGGAIVAAPLIESEVAYLGSADGSFYAIRIADGKTLWRTVIGAPVLSSAALKADKSRVFFVAENVKAYALNTSDGSILWQYQLQGQSGSDRWPVVLGERVIFRTMPIRFFHDLLHDGDDVMDSAGPVLADWAADWNAIRPKIVQHLIDKPYDQTFFALETTTGQPSGIAPMLYTFGNNDPPAPPVVYNQSFYVPYRARHGIQTDSGATHVSSRYDAEIGHMDPVSLDAIVGLTSSDAYDRQFRMTSDEPAVLSAAGDLLLVDSWERLGGIDLTTRKLVGIAQVAHEFPECGAPCEANDKLIPFYDSYPFPSPRIAEGQARSGAVVASGRIFWRVLESGLASIGSAKTLHEQIVAPIPAQIPIGHTSDNPTEPSQISTQELRDYVWLEPNRPTDAPADLRARLEQEVQRIVATNDHLLPFYLERGFNGDGSWPPDTGHPPEPAEVAGARAFWFDPGELIMTLSIAYPYLSTSLQNQVRAYLKAEMDRYPPLDTLGLGNWLIHGKAREFYPVPIRSSLSAWPSPDVPIQTLYALWTYARYTGDWAYLSARWGAINALFSAKKDTIDSYAEIAGAIGYARIAKHLGDTAAAKEGETAAVAAMQAGLNFAQWRDRASNLYPDSQDVRRGQRGQVFFGLTPEVGRYLRDTNASAIGASLNDIIGYPNGSYLWYVTRLGLQSEPGESSYHTPELAWSIFLAQAYIRQANQAQLRYWLDRPWGLGDVWYLQKLVATIEASPTKGGLLLPMIRSR